jgi:RNA polymerase sigma-70 factor, ECF subfamily
MDGNEPFEALMARLRAGDHQAAGQIFERFAHRLIALARSRLDQLLRQKEDPEDVLQSVFRSFFLRAAHGQFELKDWESLWGMLTLITIRKCESRAEYFRATRRDVHREVAAPTDSPAGLPLEALAREPSPAEVVMLSETVEQLMRGLDGREQEMLSLHLQGYSVPEISVQVGRAERTIHRLLAHVRKRLQRLRDGDAA